MKHLLILVLLIASAFAEEPVERPKVPLAIALPHLKSIEHHAIIIGNGPIRAYVFIDPNCPNSQNFVSLIEENAKMRSRYTYYLFLYELKRFKSRSLIAQIYSASDPISAMEKTMIEHISPENEIKAQVYVKIDEISKAAEALDIYKRPYIILVKKDQ